MSFFKTLSTTAIALLVVACSGNEETAVSNFPSDRVVRICAGINNSYTRGFYTTDNLQEFSISIVNTNNGNYNYDNIKVTGSNSSEWNTQTVMLWQNGKQKVDIIAYAPYQTGTAITGNTTLEAGVQATQTKDDNSSDFLLYVSKGFTPSSDLNADKELEIPLSHAFSKLTVRISLGNAYNVSSLTDTNPITGLTIKGTIITGVCNLTADKPQFIAKASESATNVMPYEIAYAKPSGILDNAVATYECILVPQRIYAYDLSVSFVVDGTTYHWKVPEEIDFEPGMNYDLSIKAGNNSITSGTMSAKPWKDPALGTDYHEIQTEYK